MARLFCAEEKLTFLFFDFVAAEVLLGLYEEDVLADSGVVFFERELVWSVHGIFLCVIKTDTRFFADEADELALGVILFCHNAKSISHQQKMCYTFLKSAFLRAVLYICRFSSVG